MPTITAQAIIDRAQIILQDTTGIRWPETTELLGWLNEGQREIAVIRPDSSVSSASFSCVTGSRQTLPSTALGLVDVIRVSNGGAVRKVPRAILDAQIPGWHALAAGTPVHYTYDPRAPREFYVYPPATAALGLTVLLSVPPTDCASIGAVVSVDDTYAPALLDYILWRAYSKDAEYTANLDRANAARASFDRLLGLKAKADETTRPTDNVPG